MTRYRETRSQLSTELNGEDEEQLRGLQEVLGVEGVNNGDGFRTGDGLKRFPRRGLVTNPGDKVLEFPIMTARVDNFLNIPFFLVKDNNRRRRRNMARN